MVQWTVRLGTTTSAGKVTTTEVVTFSRPAVVSTLAEASLMLNETKTLLAALQASMLCDQVAAYAAHHRVCATCGALQPLKDRRARQLQTLFGTVAVEAPQSKLCRFRPSAPMVEARTVSPVCALLPASPANQESARTRTHAIALRIEAADRQAATEVTAVRDEPDNPTRRFALMRSVAGQPHPLLRAALQDQGWREGEAVTVISDGDPALPALVRSATGGPEETIVDWFHLSMRVRHPVRQ